MTRKKKDKPEVTLEQLQAVAANFNSIMFEDGKGIPIDVVEYDALLAEVTDTAGELEGASKTSPGDTISAETAATLEALGIDHPAEVEEAEEGEEGEEGETDTDDAPDGDLTEDEVMEMSKKELTGLVKEKGLKIAAADKKKLDDFRNAVADQLFGEEESKEDPPKEEEKEDDPEPQPLEGEAAEAVEAAIAKVKKSRTIKVIREVAKSSKISIPPPFLKDLKKMKPYVVGKLEAILAGEVKPKKAAAKKEKKKGKGVIATIADSIQNAGKKGVSKEDILKDLESAFPDRNPESMKKTINVQVPNRMSKEKFQIEKMENGNFKAA